MSNIHHGDTEAQRQAAEDDRHWDGGRREELGRLCAPGVAPKAFSIVTDAAEPEPPPRAKRPVRRKRPAAPPEHTPDDVMRSLHALRLALVRELERMERKLKAVEYSMSLIKGVKA